MKQGLVVVGLMLAAALGGGRAAEQVAGQIVAQAGSPGRAAPGEPLRTAECERALQALQAREQQAASAPRANASPQVPPLASDARYQALRRSAAKACLGGSSGATPAPPARFAQQPVSVAPVNVAPPVASPAASLVLPNGVPPAKPTATAPAGPPMPATPAVVTSCDPAGCWASDGSRLNRMGPNLIGPRGLCTQQGLLLQCP